MKPKSILQILNAELNTCKANAPREKVMVAGGWFIKETAEQTKKDLKEFKAFVKENLGSRLPTWLSISATQGKRPKPPPWKQQEAASNAGKKRRHKTPRPERGGSRNETVSN